MITMITAIVYEITSAIVEPWDVPEWLYNVHEKVCNFWLGLL